MFSLRRCLALPILAAVLCSALLLGCGKESARPASLSPGSDGSGLHDRPVEGALTPLVKFLQSNESPEPCDRVPRLRAIQLELAQALDDRADAIDAYVRSQPPSQAYRRVPLGPIVAREPLKKLKPSAPGWQAKERFNWERMAALYRKIRGEPIDARWIQLNGDVRRTLREDENRRSGSNAYVGHEDGPKLDAVARALAACLARPACQWPELDPETEAFAAANPPIRWRLDDARDAREGSPARRSRLEDLKRITQAWAKRYRFILNRTIRRESEGTLVLPLQAGELAGAEERIAGYVEPVWSSSRLRVRLEWVRDADPASRVFRFLTDPQAGGTSFVSQQDREIHLSNDVITDAIAHEIGHALGFRDAYWYVWRTDTCSYYLEANEEDLMSNSYTGHVPEERWEKLDRAYPFAGRGPGVRP